MENVWIEFFTNAEIILGIDDGSRGSTQTSAMFPQIVERGHPLDMPYRRGLSCYNTENLTVDHSE